MLGGRGGAAALPPWWLTGAFACLQHVANMMLRMKRECAGPQNQILPVFDSLLLLDRNVDLLTPLATQLTYEGLVDEIYGITNGAAEPSPSSRSGVPSADPPPPADPQVTSSCPLRSLQRRNRARAVKTC